MSPMNDPRSPHACPLTIGVAAITAVYAALYRFVPYEQQAFLLWPFGALALYAGARLRLWHALLLVFAVQVLTDVNFYFAKGYGISKTTYLSFGLFVLLGVAVRPVLRRHWATAAAGVGGASIVGYVLFFLITNTAAWLGNARPYYEPHTFQTLMQAYAEGLEFLRTRPGEFIGNPLCVEVVFGAHALLARAYFPAEQFGAEGVR
jgi:hypothetical protein